MARRPRQSDRRRIEELLDRHEPEVRRAFLEAIDDLRNGVDLAALMRALETGDVAGALRAARIEAAAFSRLRRAIEAVYIAAGEDAVTALPVIRDWTGSRIGVRFDPEYPRAADWVSRHSSTMITRVVEDQRASIRNVVEAGLRNGTNPRTVGAEIAGRVDAITRRRTGGIIGLTDQQRLFISNPNPDGPPGAVQQLLSGDRDQMRAYLTRQARNRRYDAAVLKAIEEGRPVDPATVQKITDHYHDSLLKYRADTIARNETADATSAARRDAMQQTMDAAGIADNMLEKTWNVHSDGRERNSHAAMRGQKVRGLNTPYVSGFGNRLMRPHDPNAPIEDTIQCRCFETFKILRAEEVT